MVLVGNSDGTSIVGNDSLVRADHGTSVGVKDCSLMGISHETSVGFIDRISIDVRDKIGY